MCFSAPASFIASGVLSGIGTYCVKKAYYTNKNYLMLALIPLIFGLQQFIEGLIWLSIYQNVQLTRFLSLYFIFFAYFLWPIWMPLAVLKVEVKDQEIRRKLLSINVVLSCFFAVVVYLPLLVSNDWIQVSLCKYSIAYDTNLLFGLRHHVYMILIVYVLLAVGPFWISSKSNLNIFGVLLLISLIGALIINRYTFTSVWCFFAALLSIYLIKVISESA